LPSIEEPVKRIFPTVKSPIDVGNYSNAMQYSYLYSNVQQKHFYSGLRNSQKISDESKLGNNKKKKPTQHNTTKKTIKMNNKQCRI